MNLEKELTSRALSRFLSIALLALISIAAHGQVTTYHYDNSRTGTTLGETVLTTSNVNTRTFGKLFSLAVDGQIYAQPLYVPNVTIPQKGVHNAVFIATEHNSVYAFDADSPGAPLWQVNLGPPMPYGVCCAARDLFPEIGITSTPVIDPNSGILYVVAESYESGVTFFRLHALDITTGQDKLTPAVIQGSVPGTSSDSRGGLLTFAPFWHWQRPGLLLLNGNIYIGFGSHQDSNPYHGWLFAYSAAALQQTGILSLAPDGEENGVWQGGVGLAADAGGNIYLETGNGPLDANSGGRNYGDAIVKVATAGGGLSVLDYFSPVTQASDDANDWDLGSSGPLLIPGTSIGVAGGKDGKLYVFNMGNLGQYHPSGDQLAQEWQATYAYTGTAGGFWGGNYIYYNSKLYGFGERDLLKTFSFNGSQFNTTPVSTSTFIVPSGFSNDPAMSISANGSAQGTGIVWAAFSTNGIADGSPQPGILHAFDAADVSRELWNSNQNSAQDSTGSWAKWCPPIVAKGKVYLASFDKTVNVYGLLTTSGGSGGTLTGAGSSVTTTANLTTEGPVDWLHWGPSLIRKTGVSPQISNYSIVGSGSAQSYRNDPRALSWSDGTPTVAGTDNNGLYISTAGNGFSFTVPADTTSRVLTVHVGGWSSGGTLTARLSDRSATNFVDITTPASGQYDRNYTITYSAASAAQTLTVTWVMTSGTGNVTLNGAALAQQSGTGISATAGTPQSATVSTVFATALQATVKDTNGSPLSGVTVTFTAPSTGATASFSGSSTATALTNASGIATAPALTANNQAGSYTVTASASGAGAAASFSLTNLAASPASIAATAGTPQSATVNTAFTTALQATVKDTNGNPLNGVTVTFTAPTTGAAATFSGQATATATTNASGIATAPALTANSQSGTFTVTGAVAGVATPATFSLTNTAATGGGTGSLAGAGSSVTTTASLTTEGAADWMHWGPSLIRKAGVNAQISAYSIVGSGSVQSYRNDLRALSWTDGTPTASGTDNNGLYINGSGNGFSFTVPADTTQRVLTVHVGGWSSGGTLTARLSDGSAPNFVDTTAQASAQYDRNYSLTYSAATAGQTLTVSWVMSAGGGNVTLNGAALSQQGGGGSSTIAATAGTPQSATVNTAFATALQAIVKDSSGNPLAGMTVTFTAPTTGASATFSGGSNTATVTTSASGIATAPTLIANGQTGTFTVMAAVSGSAASTAFSLTNTAASGGGNGALTGSGTGVTTTASLTAEGPTDWMHWGPSLIRKSGVSSQISGYAVVGSGTVQSYRDDPRTLSWTDGTPTASGSDKNGIFINGSRNGFSFTVPADTTQHVLTVHVGGWNSAGTLTARLSDGSAPSFVDTTTQVSGQYDRNYTITYNAAFAGQTLSVTWVMSAGGGNVTLNGAALN